MSRVQAENFWFFFLAPWYLLLSAAAIYPAIEKQDEPAIPFLCGCLLVEAPRQGFIEIAPRHGDGIDRRVRPEEGLVMAFVRRGFFRH